MTLDMDLVQWDDIFMALFTMAAVLVLALFAYFLFRD